MRRTLEPVDLMVELGDCATVMGGYFLHVAASGTLEAATPEPIAIGRTAGIMDAMDWVQPVLGQAIVDDYLLGREASSRTIAAAAEFNRATMIGHRLRSLPLMPFEGIRASAAEAEADHAARVQFVLGEGTTMSTWGAWGYWGIVAGLFVLLAIYFTCMEILYSNARKRPMAGNASSPARQEERATTCSKHAAQA